jgi:hypothetical protein
VEWQPYVRVKFEIPSLDALQTAFEVLKTSAPIGEARLDAQVIPLLAARGVPEGGLYKFNAIDP